MIALTLASAVGGALYGCMGTEVVTGNLEFDSRLVGPGGVFAALPGERVDGHDFVAGALAAGAVGVLAGRPVTVPLILAPRRATGSRSLLGAPGPHEAGPEGSGAAEASPNEGSRR